MSKEDEELDPTLEGDEPSAGKLSMNEELEAALREAEDSLAAARGTDSAGGGSAVDKVTIEALSHELRSLTEKHSETLAELQELKDKHVRLQAEFENFRKRGIKERQEAHQFGHQNLVKDLLPTVDNLDRAVAHAEESEDADLQSLLQGVDLVRKELFGVLARHGVTGIDAAGLTFDPAVHEAMAQAEDASVAPNTVVDVLEKGYKLHDRMLRPSRVVVSKHPDEIGPGSEEN